MYHRIAKHLNTNNILIDEQFGFRAGNSCEAQLISVIEDTQLATNNTSQVDMIFIDFRKGFDTVPHCGLLNKLSHYGIQGLTYDWIKIWLTQCVVVIRILCKFNQVFRKDLQLDH